MDKFFDVCTFPFFDDSNIRNKYVGSYICYFDKNGYKHYCVIKDFRIVEENDSILFLCDGFFKTECNYHWCSNFSIKKRKCSLSDITVISKSDFEKSMKEYINDLSANFHK